MLELVSDLIYGEVKMNSIGMYKNPYNNQYVAPYGYCFYLNGVNQGRIIWTSMPENYYIDKDDNG